MTKPSEKKSNIDSRYWITPPGLYQKLDKEFHFDFDPCPYIPPEKIDTDGCMISWGRSNYVNPPFRSKDAFNGKGPTAFTRKAIEEQIEGKTSVLILPVQGYVNLLFAAGAECRPCGRVKWLEAESGLPTKSPSNNAIFILRGH